MIQWRMTAIPFKVLIAVLISLCAAQLSPTSQQITPNWTPVYENLTISTYTNDANSSNTLPTENVTDSTTNYSAIKDSITKSSAIENSTTNSSAIEDSITKSSVIEDSTTKFSVIKDSTTKSSVIEDSTTKFSVIKDSTTKSSVIEDSTTKFSAIKDSTTISSVIEDSTTKSSAIEDSTNKSSVIEDSTNKSSVIEDSTTKFSVIKDSTTKSSVIEDSTTKSSVIEDSTNKSSVIEDSTNKSSLIEDSTNKSSLIEDSTTNSSAIKDSATISSVIDVFSTESHHYATTISSIITNQNVNESSTINSSASMILTTTSPENIDILLNDSAVPNLNTKTSVNVSNIVQMKKTTDANGVSENTTSFNKTVIDDALNTTEYNRSSIESATLLAGLNDSVLETATVANVSNVNETLYTTKVFDYINITNETIPVSVVDGFTSVSNGTLNNVDAMDNTPVTKTEATIAQSNDSPDITTQGYIFINNTTREAIQVHNVSTTKRFETSSTPYLRPTTHTMEEVSSTIVTRKTTAHVPKSSDDSQAAPPVKPLPPPPLVSRIFEQKTPENPPPIIVNPKSLVPEPRLTARKTPTIKPTTLSPPPPPPIIIPPQAKATVGRIPTHPLHRSQTPKPDPFDPQARFPSLREFEGINPQQIDTLKTSTIDKFKHMTPITAPFSTQTSSISRTGETDTRQTFVSSFNDQDFIGLQFFKPKNLIKDRQMDHPTPRKSFFDLQPLDKRLNVGSSVNLTSFSQEFFKPQPEVFRPNPISEQPSGNIPSMIDVTKKFKIGDLDITSLGLNLDQPNKNIVEKSPRKLNKDTISWTPSVALVPKRPVEEKPVVSNNVQPPVMPWDISSLDLNLNIPSTFTSRDETKVSLKEKQTIFSKLNGSNDRNTNSPVNYQTPLPINSGTSSAIGRWDFSSLGIEVNIPVTESEQKGIIAKKNASVSSKMQPTENVSSSLKWNIPNLGVDLNVPAVRRLQLDKKSSDKQIQDGLVRSGPFPLPPSPVDVIHDQGRNLNTSPPGPDVFTAINSQMDSEILPVGAWNFMNIRRPPNIGQGLTSQRERDTDTTKSTGIQKSKLPSVPEFKPLQFPATFSGNSQSLSLDNVRLNYENQDSIRRASVPRPDHVPSARNSSNIIRKIKPIDWNISFMPTGIVSKPNLAESSNGVSPLKNVETNIFTQPQDRSIDGTVNPMEKDRFSRQNTIHDLKPKTPSPLEPPPIFPYLTRAPTTPKPKTKGHPLVTSSSSGLEGISHNGKGRICDSCVFVNEICYVPHEVHCNQYYECVSQGGAVHLYTRECAVGLFFNRTNFLCGHPDMTDCSTDRCRQNDVREYALEGHCTYHWSCRSSAEGSYPEIQCCPNNGAFKEGEGCIEDPNCKESCSVDSVTNATNAKLQGCNLVKTDSPSTYLDTQANLVRPCAPGTIFVESKCTCVQNATSERDTNKTGEGPCSANLKMTFPDPKSDSITDSSKNRQSVGVQNVAISKNGTALFYGTGKLILWRFAHQMFGSVLAIQLDFLNKQNEPRYQVLLTNCNPSSHGGNPSIEIRVDTLYHEVIFEVDTYQARQQRMKLHYLSDTWNTVTFIYDGERAVGAVNRRARNLLLEGGIETRPSPFTIGGCREADSFRGEMDEIYVYEDCLPHNMISIFQSVLE